MNYCSCLRQAGNILPLFTHNLCLRSFLLPTVTFTPHFCCQDYLPINCQQANRKIRSHVLFKDSCWSKSTVQSSPKLHSMCKCCFCDWAFILKTSTRTTNYDKTQTAVSVCTKGVPKTEIDLVRYHIYVEYRHMISAPGNFSTKYDLYWC